VLDEVLRFSAYRNTIDKLPEVWPCLSSDEKKLFDVIARAYMAALMPDFHYRKTTATLDVPASNSAQH
jgi:DNA topoisomerase-3